MGEADEKATAVLDEIEERNEKIAGKTKEMGERLENVVEMLPVPGPAGTALGSQVFIPKSIENAEYEQRLWREIERLRCALRTIAGLAEEDERVREMARDALLGSALQD